MNMTSNSVLMETLGDGVVVEQPAECATSSSTARMIPTANTQSDQVLLK